MRERQVLEAIEEISVNWYKKTGDKWWKKLADMVAEKRKEVKWWLK